MKETPASNIPNGSLTYQKPPSEILDLVDVARVPFVQVDLQGRYALYIHRDAYPSLASLYAPEMRLAGLRVNPTLNINSRETYYAKIEIKDLQKDKLSPVNGLPTHPRLSNFTWSSDQTKLAFTNTTDQGVQAWYVDLETAQAHCLTAAKVNANLERPLAWMQDDQSLLIKLLPEIRPALQDTKTNVPERANDLRK